MSAFKRGFKVVGYERGQLRSWSAPNGMSERVYYVGRATYPAERCGPLAVFARLDDALAMLSGCGDPRRPDFVFECLYEQSRTWSLSCLRSDGSVKWRGAKGLPEGTDFADCVVLLRLVLTRKYAENGYAD